MKFKKRKNFGKLSSSNDIDERDSTLSVASSLSEEHNDNLEN